MTCKGRCKAPVREDKASAMGAEYFSYLLCSEIGTTVQRWMHTKPAPHLRPDWTACTPAFVSGLSDFGDRIDQEGVVHVHRGDRLMYMGRNAYQAFCRLGATRTEWPDCE